MRKLLVISMIFIGIGCDKTVREARLRPAQTLEQRDAVALKE